MNSILLLFGDLILELNVHDRRYVYLYRVLSEDLSKKSKLKILLSRFPIVELEYLFIVVLMAT